MVFLWARVHTPAYGLPSLRDCLALAWRVQGQVSLCAGTDVALLIDMLSLWDFVSVRGNSVGVTAM